LMTDSASTKVIQDLYAGTLEVEAWGRAMLGLADMVRASGALLLAFDPASGAVLRDEIHRFDPGVVDNYRRYWTYEDSRRVHFLATPVACPVTERTLGISQWCRSPILNEFLLPADAPHFMPAWLHKSGAKAVTISLQGTRRRGPFDGGDIENFRQILPHVARALEIRDRLEHVQLRSKTLAITLDRLALGVLLLDSRGRVLEANSQAQELLREGNGIRRNHDGTFWLRESAGSELGRWVRTGEPLRRSAMDGLLHVRRAMRLPLSVLVTPLPRRSVSWVAQDSRWLVLLIDPERRIEACAELIGRDLDITAREAEIAALLVSGYGVQNIAVRLHVSPHTVRTQLKSIFRKTGSHTQSELIRRIALGPALLRSRSDTPFG